MSPEQRAQMLETATRVRQMWEDGMDVGDWRVNLALNSLLVVQVCWTGVAPGLDQALEGAEDIKDGFYKELVLRSYDGIQEKWGFQGCLWVSPLIADVPDSEVPTPIAPD